MLFDFKIFYTAGQAVLTGASPYADPNFVYPLPTAYFYALWALMPFGVAGALWTIASAAAVIAVCRRAAPLWLLFPPVFGQLLTGQSDLLLLGLWALTWRGSAVALGLMTLKPHLLMLILPYTLWGWRREARKLASFAATVAALYLPATLARPQWVAEWLRNVFALAGQRGDNPGVFALALLGDWAILPVAIAGVVIVVWCWKRGRAWANFAGLAVNPAVQFYDFALLAGPWFLWRTVLAGWIGWLAYLFTDRFVTNAIVLPVAWWEMSRRPLRVADGG